MRISYVEISKSNFVHSGWFQLSDETPFKVNILIKSFRLGSNAKLKWMR